MELTRRDFMGSAVSGAAIAGTGSLVAGGTGAGITVGMIGVGIRGTWLMDRVRDAGGRIAIVSDLYEGRLRRVRELSDGIATTRDYQEVLARKDIQAVVIATSDHWHAPIAMAAMQAGKDVYCEKPMSHTIGEALEMTEVSGKTGRLIQVGSQSLSMATTQKAKQWVEQGAIGDVFMVSCSINRDSANGAWRYPIPQDASPQTIDWQRFLGSAPARPFDASRFFHFRNWWDYGTGIAGDEYVHLLSRVHYVLGVTYPKDAVAHGGIYKWKGDREVPDIHNTLYNYGTFQVQVSANLASNWDGGEIVRFQGDRGTIELKKWDVKLFRYAGGDGISYEIDSWPQDQRAIYLAAHPRKPKVRQPAPESFTMTREGTEDHFRNLFACMQTREQPVESVSFGLGTAVACHMANTSYREKRRVFWDAEKRVLG